jgi:SAM-dependent methyltransferase
LITVKLNWYEDFFEGIAVDLWRKAVPPEHTAAEIEFIGDALALPAGARILDVPCGCGRHSLELARRGYRMTGIDISADSIAEARASAAAEGLEVKWVLGDMRRIPKRGRYDGAFCFGNSFGYLEWPDMEAFLDGVARVLRPGARFVLETGMAAESVIPKFTPRETFRIDDIEMRIESRYRADLGCVDEQYTFVRDGQTEVRPSVHWVYTAAEIRRMLERAGLGVLEIYGSLDRQPFTLGSVELIVVSEKRD